MKNNLKNPRVSIIILNWNGWKDTIECLESLYQIDYTNFNVIVVDNNSTDDSIEKIKKYCNGEIKIQSKLLNYQTKNKPIKIVNYNEKELIGLSKEKNHYNLESYKKLTIIENIENYGFAKGNNIAIKYCINKLNSDYILLLNNDIVVDKKFLNHLIKVAEEDEKIGILGSTVYSYNYPNCILSAGMKLNWKRGTVKMLGFKEMDIGQFKDISKVDYVDGSNMLITRGVFEKIGYLNPDYFLYWEETDFCVRTHKANYGVVNVYNAKVWHKLGSSTKKVSGSYEYFMTRNMFWFMKSHASKKQFLSILVYFFVFRFWFKSSIFLLYHRDLNTFRSFLNGVFDGLKIS
jgi:GT2 family glycosyltransferase